MVLDPGGASGSGSDDPDDAEEQLTETDPGSDSGSDDTQTVTSPSGSGGGFTSGGGETTTEDPNAPSDDAREELTRRDQGSGGGDTGGPSSGGPPGGGFTSGGGETATSPNDASDDDLADAARDIAEQNVDETQEEGIEAEGVGDPSLQSAAATFEQQVIDEYDAANDPRDIVIRERDGELVASLSRSRAIELLAEDIQEDFPEQVVSNMRRDDRPAGTGLDPGGALGPTAQAVDDPSDLVFEYRDGDLEISLTEETAAEIAAQRQENLTDADLVDDAQEGGRSGDPTPPLAKRAEAVFEATREQGLSSIERGGALSEAARNTTATGLGVFYQNPAEGRLTKALGISGERARAHNTNLSGPGIVAVGANTGGVTPIEYEQGAPGQINQNVSDALGKGEGLLSQEQRQEIKDDIEQRQGSFDYGDAVGGFVGDVTGDERAAAFATGVGRLPADAATATADLTLAADTTAEIAGNLPDAVGEFGAPAVGGALLEAGGRGVDQLFQGASANPHEFAGGLTGALVGGAAASRAIRSAPSRVRGTAIRSRGGRVYDLEELSDPPLHTEGMGLPGFTRQARRDPEVARREFVQQAKQGPLSGGGRRLGVNIRRDSDSPLLTLDPELKAAIEGAPGRARQSIATRAEAVRTFPTRAGERLDETAFDAGVRVGEATRRAEALPGDLRAGAATRLDNLDDAAFQAGQRTGEAVSAAEDFVTGAELSNPTSVRALAASGLRRADDAAFAAGERVGGRLRSIDESAFDVGLRAGRRVSDAEDFLTELPGEIDNAAFEAGVRTGERISDIEDLVGGGQSLNDAAFGAGVRVGEATRRLEDAPRALRLGAEERLATLDEAAFDVGVRTGEVTRRLEAVPGAVRNVAPSRLGDLDDTAFEAGVRTGRRVSDAEDFLTELPGEVDDVAFQAGVRTGEKISEVEDLLGGPSGGLDDSAFQAGVRVGEATRRAEALPGDLRAGAATRLDNLDDAAFTAGERAGEAIRRISEADPSSIGDLTIELELSEVDATPVAFHGRDPAAVAEFGGFGSRFEAPEGGSELPGLFQAADLSPLRISEASGSSGGLNLPRLGLPTARGRSSRVLAEEDLDVGITEGRSRQEVSAFLEEDASREKSFIRTDSGGGPTPEQEAIAPPGSVFEESGGVFGVRVGGTSIPFTDRRVGGEIIPGRLTRRVGGVDADDAGEAGFTQTELATETTEAITSTSRAVYEEPSPAAPLPASAPSGGSTDAGSDEGAFSVSEDSGFSSEPDSLLDEDPATTTSAPDETSSRGGTSGSSTGVSSSGSGASGSSSGASEEDLLSEPPTTSIPPTGGGSDIPPPSEPPGPPSTPSSPPGPPGVPTTPPPGPPPVPLFDLDVPEPDRRNRRRGIDPFEEDFEFGVASAEEVLEGGITGTAKSDELLDSDL